MLVLAADRLDVEGGISLRSFGITRYGEPLSWRDAVFSPFTGIITTHTRFTDNIVRVGLNYKFGYAAAPAVYK